ncbi:hypothetical protein CAP48_12995 [Advenella sp. S44]|uniref:mandelate racemase/muconate lactonizing enzyme family protein n=1 Tax=Advenella sp. S44 TaxID=1982755 RepID=UPI000C29A8DB|nr:mandelate racemase/muconate lactonizing enzyme family protein [Advenella sp. S44]PJX22980.1 hypothetical protein CAP48_12995 [Advenella sp. S44]
MSTITSVTAVPFNVSPKTNWFFILVQMSDGTCGWGEASLNGWEVCLQTATGLHGQPLVGLSAQDAITQLHPSPVLAGGLVSNAVLSALAQALWTIHAQQEAIPLHAALAPLQRKAISVYANINRATVDRTPSGFAQTAKSAAAVGFGAFKAAPFDGVTPALCAAGQADERIRHGIECLYAIREAVGPQARLMVDCHWRFDEMRALEVLRQLEDAHLHWFECPMAENYNNWDSLRRVKEQANEQNVLIAAAETQVGVAAFEMQIREKLLDVVMPDIKYCGGPAHMLAIAEMAADHDILFAPHNPTGPVCTLTSLHVACVARKAHMLELQFAESPLYDALIRHQHPSLENGKYQVTNRNGLGVELDRQLMSAHPYKPVPFGIESLLAV